MMKSTKPIRPGVVIPADSGSVFFMCRKEGERAFRMRTKVWPPKYICVPYRFNQLGGELGQFVAHIEHE